MNNRRKLFLALGAGALAAPLVSFTQQLGKVWRVGFLRGAQFSAADSVGRDAFFEELHSLGYIEGKNLAIEWRFAGSEPKLFPEFASELVRLNVDAIFSAGTPATQAAQSATSTIPVVMINVGDPVASGVVKSLARPNGNITGVSDLTGELGPKNLEMLIRGVPGLSRIAVLVDTSNPSSALIAHSVQVAAPKARITILPMPVSNLQEIESALLRMKQQKAGAFIIASGGIFTQHIRRIAQLAIDYRLPTASTGGPHVPAGVLMSYGTNQADSYRLAARYLDKILKGAKPADLPVEQPTRFELIVNRKTARALGLTIPQSLLVSADKVIE